MTGDQLRKAFLKFFKEKDHLIMPSAPLVPKDDPTILWINAGMAPFKPYFNGELTPPSKRIATSQKCIRTNDIENVGKTDRHHTFFEMLGNFSFGDYFKKEAINWAWEFVTEVLKLDSERLWITIYKDDDQAFDIWRNDIGLSENRIVRMGKKENYWQIGTGPCGPCSEIHYDRGEEYGPDDVVGEEGDRFLEIWNLVFTQYDYTEEGEYKPLPNKNIDTGMGFERVLSILQGVPSNFETDLFKPIIDHVVQETGINYKKNKEIIKAYRVIADHIRGITMAIFDGVLPSNEGRGYVIRRLIRRAVRFGSKLGYEKPFLYSLVPVVNEVMSGGYPDLVEQEEHIKEVIEAEEERFYRTLDQGLNILNEMILKLEENNKNTLSGKKAFKLYDTYGFPLDLTEDVLQEKGFTVDQDGFEMAMEKQKQRAREAREENSFNGSKDKKIYDDLKQEKGPVEFAGYRNTGIETYILGIIKDGQRINNLKNGQEGELILKRTPFYAESGGQVGDTGTITSDSGLAEVKNTNRKSKLITHQVEIKKGELRVNDGVKAEVYKDKRQATANNHSATHLLHKVLKEVLGDHVKQSGSLVSPEKLRFDFSHYSSLTFKELNKIEKLVNERIRKNYSVETLTTSLEKAKDMGAVALFDEKYGELVRIVKMGNYTIELCGGTHVDFTGEIGLFKIISENSVAAGIRRIEALTAGKALEFVQDEEKMINEIAAKVKSEPEKLVQKIDQLIEEKSELKGEITSLKEKLAGFRSHSLIEEIEEIKGIPLLTVELKGLDKQALLNLGDQIKNKINSGIIILASNQGNNVLFLAMITEDLVKEGYHAGKMVAEIAKITDGGGGGRPDMAQAGGSNVNKIQEALDEAKNIIRNK